jgi:hypothetical protein
VDLGGEHSVSKISLAFVFPFSEFPRALSVNGYHRSRRWQRLKFSEDPWRNSRVVKRLVEDPTTATMDLVLDEPLLLERLRLFIRESDPTDELPEWRIPEIRIFESSLGPEASQPP